MIEYIKGPSKDMAAYIREQGGILLEQQPFRLAPTGSYICVLLGSESEIAAVVQDDSAMRRFAGDTRIKQWLHVDTDTLKKLLYDGGNV